MLVTFSNEAQSEMLEVSEDTLVKDLKLTLEAIFEIPSNQLVLVKQGQELSTSTESTLQQIGIVEQDFIIVVNSNTVRAAATPASNPSQTVSWDGMSVLDVLERNSNPANVVDIVQKPGNERLLNELRFRNQEDLAKIFALPRDQAIKGLQKYLILNNAKIAMRKITTQNKEESMRSKLEVNPNDTEAKEYFAEIERKKLIDEQYYSVLNNYPESLTHVLMLYINVKVNGIPVQAFVDSGAQTSVMSLQCAKKLEVDNLIDDRFAGKVVGVGTGQSLGKIHMAPLNIKNNFFPMSVTVLGGEQGLGDKNMEFLLGLDMLKRHKCTIDLVKGVLTFQGSNGAFIETEFLHEKDLAENKGGTKGYSPDKKS